MEGITMCVPPGIIGRGGEKKRGRPERSLSSCLNGCASRREKEKKKRGEGGSLKGFIPILRALEDQKKKREHKEKERRESGALKDVPLYQKKERWVSDRFWLLSAGRPRRKNRIGVQTLNSSRILSRNPKYDVSDRKKKRKKRREL